jgi:hypothetical protein
VGHRGIGVVAIGDYSNFVVGIHSINKQRDILSLGRSGPEVINLETMRRLGPMEVLARRSRDLLADQSRPCKFSRFAITAPVKRAILPKDEQCQRGDPR